MKTNLTRTAYNTIIYEALDFTVGLFTPEGETISIGLGLPMFIRGMSETVRAKVRALRATRTSSRATSSSPTTPTPPAATSIISRSACRSSTAASLTAFACCMAHWQDVGGQLGGVTTDIYSEGIQIPIVKYQKEGVVNQDLVDIIAMNVRLPERAMGDLRAQVTAVKTGERRFIELLERYGREPVMPRDPHASWTSPSAPPVRARARSPTASTRRRSFMDDDGVEVGNRIPIKVRVIVEGDEMTIDLTEVSRQVRGFYNSGETTGYACAQVAYKCITSPTDYPINEGSFRSLKVKLTPGTVVSAVKPAAMRWWMTFPMTIVDTIFKALEPAVPTA